ncbi:MAG TPA: hypothetical protein PL009_14190 [Flavipsychrobacter sp.]|nr:hypothetical protein [Flavipsychrobacter sp.]
MRKILIASSFVAFTSCEPSQTTIDDSRREAIIDSLVAIRMEEITRQATEDFDRRRSIEVKAKADSIVTSKNASKISPPNNTISNNLPMP